MKTRIHLILTAACLLFTYGITAQNIITVNNNPGSTTAHQALQSAIDAASDGDTIYLQPSETIYGTGTINKSLTIVGRSHSEPNKESSTGSLTITASNVTIKGLEMSILRMEGITEIVENVNIFECYASTTFIGVDGTFEVSNVVLQGSAFRSTINVGVNSENVLIANNVISSSNLITIDQATSTIVTNNVFKTASTNSTLINNDTAPLILSNNMFFGGGAGTTGKVFEFNTGTFILNNNLTHRTGSSTIQLTTTNGGSITQNNTLANTNPSFTSIQSGTVSSFGGGSSYNPAASLTDDFTLQAGSPALTGGTNGSQIGVYGGNFLYKQLGQPRGIPTLDIISNDVTVQQGGTLNITINAKAN